MSSQPGNVKRHRWAIFGSAVFGLLLLASPGHSRRIVCQATTTATLQACIHTAQAVGSSNDTDTVWVKVAPGQYAGSQIRINRRKNLVIEGDTTATEATQPQIIFQDPFSSLNPRMRIKNIIGEGARIHGLATGSDVLDKVADIMTKVGLSKDHMSRFPHEFSGGQRQRIGVARALILNPKLIVCDEAVSALDVSIQAQILNLLNDLQKEFGLTYLFIAHDLGVVKHISKRVAVMYLGKVAELSDKKKLFDDPLHPYTVSLMSAIPEANPEKKKQRIILQGDVPSPINPPSGCRFHPRCPIAKEVCSREEPQLQDVGGGHFVSCFFPGQLKR